MREVTIKLAGKDFEIERSFSVLDRITAKVVDPLWLAEEGFRAERAANEGLAYKPAYTLTFEDACRILHIAQTGNMTLEQVKEAAFETGALVVREVVMMFLTALVTPPNPQKAATKNGEKKEGE